MNATFKSIVGSLGNAKDGFVTLFNVLVNAGQTAFTELDLSIVSFRKNILETLQEVSNFEILGEQIGIKDFSEDINVANTEIEALNTQLSDLKKETADSSFSKGIEQITAAFDDFNTKTETTIGLQVELAQEIQNTEIEVLQLERGLSNLRGEQEKFLAIAEDDNLSFQRRRENFELLKEASEDFDRDWETPF